MKGGNSSTASEEIRESLLVYEGGDKAILPGILKALYDEETALLISQADVESKGTQFNSLPTAFTITEPAAPRVDDFSAVWTAIVHHPIIENPMNPRMWSLHGGIKWFGGIQQLSNRPCYDEITKKISSVTHALIYGTPGIGKTLFLQVFLVYLVRRAQAEGKDPPSIYYDYPDNGKITTVSFLPDGSVVDITKVLQPPRPDYLLSDGVDISHPSGKLLNLLVASDKESSYHSFEKRVEEARFDGQSFVMPVFSSHDIQSIQPADMDDWCAEFRYDVFGGSARNFIAVGERYCTVLPFVNETLTLMFPDIKEKHYDAWNSVAHQVSEQLRESILVSTMHSMIRHMLPGGSKIWASKFMEWLAAASVDHRDANIVYELERIIGKAGVGRLLETAGHRKLMTSMKPLLLKPLSASL